MSRQCAAARDYITEEVGQVMELGIFMMPCHPPGKPLYQAYDEDAELLILADQLGYREAFIGEHGTMGWEPIPAPDQFIARIGPVTKQIRLGTGVVLMGQHHPANTANRLAQLDHLLKGRFIFGAGTGGITTDLELFGITGGADEVGQRMMRGLDLIIKFWTEEPPYDYPGEIWPIKVENIRPEVRLGWMHRPYQKPYPPIAVPGVGGNSRLLYTAGERGWWPMSTNFANARVLKMHWQQVAAGAAAAGRTADRQQWRVAREVFVADTSAEAHRYARTGSMARAWNDYFSILLPERSREVFCKNETMSTSEINVDYLIENNWIVGDPDEVTSKLRALNDELGGFGTLLMIAHDWDDPAAWRHSMELLAKEVMPRV